MKSINDKLMNRRSFLKVNFQSSIGFLTEFFNASTDEVSYLRPPGAEGEWEFLTACTRCGVCKDVCPQGIISLFSAGDGTKLIGTPYLDLSPNPCTFCNRCIDSCPTDALSHGINSEKIGSAAIIQKNCLAFEDVMCDYCVRGCPKQALSLSLAGQPEVNTSLCNGCGVCIQVCIEETKAISIIPVERN